MRLGDRAGWSGKVSGQEVDQLRFQCVCTHIEQGQRHGKFETTATGAAGVQVQAVVAPFNQRLVGMGGGDFVVRCYGVAVMAN